MDIERLYVQATRGDDFAQNTTRRVSEGLAGLNRFVITANRDEADAALIVSFYGNGKETTVGKASFQIVNVSGEVIWRSGVIQGSAEEIEIKLRDELVKAMAKP
jgi:hypothetical protein